MTTRRDLTEERPERFKHAVRTACCEACTWPDCGCKTVAEILKVGINAWDGFLSGDEQSAPRSEPYPNEPAEVTIRRERDEWER